MSSSGKQHHPPPEPDAEPGPAAKRARPEPATGSPKPPDSLRVALNPADCDLDFDIGGNGLRGHGLHEQGFAYCWSGARANVGIRRGKYCFGCKIVSEQVVDLVDTPSDQQHVARVGISRGDDPVGNLGETLHSFGFGGTGKYSNARKFTDYGENFGVGDTIVCCVDLESRPLATIGFSKNGKWLGIASQFDASSRGLCVVDTPVKDLPWESALFPHVLLKNVVVQLQFSVEDGLIPEEGFKPWNCATGEGNAILGPSFSSPEECEVLMMVGLPASGKTTWAEKWVKEHPEKRYVILGTNLALDQMKVPGLIRKHNYGERFERLMDRATGIFNTLLTQASKTRRNYILDQTNVYKSARNRKLKAFVNYRKIAVVVFPTPNELKCRAEKRFKEMGKEVPQDAVNEMLANYVLPASKDMPRSNEVFDEVIFTELGREEAQRHLDEMKCELRSASNLTAKPNFSPNSRASSVQSFSCPVFMNKGVTPAVGGHWPYHQSASIFPHHDNLSPLQVNPSYPSPDSFVDNQARLGEAIPHLPNNSSYNHYSKNDTTAYQRDGFDPYKRSTDSGPYMRNASERSFSSIADADPYRSYRATDNSTRLSFESSRSMGIAGHGYRSDPPSYSSPGAHLHDPRVQQVPQDGFGRPRFESSSPIGRPYYNYPLDPPPSYSSPSPHPHMPRVSPLERNVSRSPYEWSNSHQTTYGSPYGPPAPRPPSGTPPAMNHPHGSWYR
ncbi:heterogeneous nuclear ribonucleoprotein U-like protein 1 [Asparagus officinalis]|uniref:heterogeneous nuclear ribonucleoprotein U-like protein 1 n=1 Tax=Asparagus officinalis TaxID=4686 RepID=UPI00098E3E2A|nr:heterogeneous nuclear ribonucleoprotein U-like protein 1 [Asparagus officinalis]